MRRGPGLLLAVALLVAACSSAETATRSATPVYELPFGLRQVDGTSAVGRPAIYDDASVVFRNKPVQVRVLKAAYEVTGDDPVAAFDAWVDQLASLPFEKVGVAPGEADLGQWLVATGSSAYRTDAPIDGWASLQLWVTRDKPLLLVDLFLRPGAKRAARAATDRTSPPPMPTPVTGGRRGKGGGVLFTEQRDDIHLPRGTRRLAPTLPTPAGTGGSWSVLAAHDGDAAVHALIEEAQSLSAQGEVQTPKTTVEAGVRVTRASFVIPAGGWGFQVVSVKADDDTYATLFVTSGAD